MKLPWIAALALVLSGCAPPAAVQGGAGRGCVASADATWTRPGAPSFAVTASTQGPDCAHGVVTLVVRDQTGEPAHVEAFPTAQVMTLAPALDADAMTRSLAEWIDQTNPGVKTSADLPVWAPGADNPISGEFPFYLEPGAQRDTYEALRKRAVPVFCYVQGMESEACLKWEDNQFDKIGVQSFPG